MKHTTALWRQFPTQANTVDTTLIPDPAQLPPVPDDDDLVGSSRPVPPSVAPTSYAPTEPEPDLEIDPLLKTPTSETFEDKRKRLDQQEMIWARQPTASQLAPRSMAEASTASASAAAGETEP